MGDSQKVRVLEQRNIEARDRAASDVAELSATATDYRGQVAGLKGALRDLAMAELDKVEGKLVAAEQRLARLSLTPEQQRAAVKKLHGDTLPAFGDHGFEYADTGLDVGTVVWARDGIRVTLRPDTQRVKITIPADVAGVAGHEAIAQAIAGLLD